MWIAIILVLFTVSTVYALKNKKYGSRSLPIAIKYYLPDSIKEVIEPLRPIGLLERWYTANHNTGIYCCVGYAAQLEGQIPSQSQMLFAMEELIRKHPQLRTATVDTDNIPLKGPSYLFWLNKIDLQSALKLEQRTDSTTWTQVFIREQHVPFTKDFEILDKKVVSQHGIAPFFRFVLVAPHSASGPFEIFFGVHHTIADGMAGIYLFKDFLEILDNARKSNATPIDLDSQLDSRVMQSQPVELVLDIRPSFWNLLRVLSEDIPFCKPTRKDWRGPPQIETYNRTSNVVLLQIPKVQTESLLQICRSHNVTLNAALFAASHFAIAKLLNTFPVVSSSTACSLRPFCEPKLPPNAIGPFVCGIEARYNLDGQIEFWNFAQQSKKTHASKIEESYQKIGMAASLTSLHKYFEKKKIAEPNARETSFALSNLGSIPFPDSFQTFSLNGCYFSTLNFGKGSVFMESVVTVHGNLCMFVSYVEQITSRTEAETFTKYIMEALNRCEEGKPFKLHQFIE